MASVARNVDVGAASIAVFRASARDSHITPLPLLKVKYLYLQSKTCVWTLDVTIVRQSSPALLSGSSSSAEMSVAMDSPVGVE